MKKILLTTVLIGSIGVLKAQECEPYFNMDEGTRFVITDFDKKHKEQGSTEGVIKEVEEGDNFQKATVVAKYFDDKKELLHETEYDVECKDGKFYIDMSHYLNTEQMSQYEGMEIEVESENLEFPSNPVAGQELGDGKVTMKVKNSGMTMFKMVTEVINRKVETIEEVTTPAGTFECIKITYVTKMKMGFVNKEYKGVEWFAPNVGMVKSETYKSNGKLVGSSELTEFTKSSS